MCSTSWIFTWYWRYIPLTVRKRYGPLWSECIWYFRKSVKEISFCLVTSYDVSSFKSIEMTRYRGNVLTEKGFEIKTIFEDIITSFLFGIWNRMLYKIVSNIMAKNMLVCKRIESCSCLICELNLSTVTDRLNSFNIFSVNFQLPEFIHFSYS